MVYDTTTGIDVILIRNGNGLPIPRVVERNGKFFRILDVKRMQFSSGKRRMPVEKYLVNINGYDKYLIKEGIAWYILNESEDEKIFSKSASTVAEAMAI